MTQNLTEFQLIDKYIKPLCDHKEAQNLQDDVAKVFFQADHPYLINQDAMVEGHHFLSWFDPKDIAYKLVASNVSDLLCKGAKPLYYLLSLMIPPSYVCDDFLSPFFESFKESLELFGGKLIGGDTTSSKQLSLSLTVIGFSEYRIPQRSLAQKGDDIWVTGQIGDAALAVEFLKEYELQSAHLCQNHQELFQKLCRPSLPLGIETIMHKYARASCDLSDGLLSDVAHISKASQLSARIDFELIPRSKAFLALNKEKYFIGGGEDYQTLFTASPEYEKNIIKEAQKRNLTLTKIGKMEEKKKQAVSLIKENQDITPEKLGFEHF